MQEQPPPFQLPSQSPTRRTNRTLWIIAACILIPCCGLIIAGALFLWKLVGEAMPFAGCMGAMERVGNALEDYTDAHNGKLPPADKWQEEILPYYKKIHISEDLDNLIKMTDEGPWGCWDQNDKLITGFAFNSGLSGKVAKDVKDPEQNPVIFEVPEIEKNQHRAYAFREYRQSPVIVFGRRRGWLELDVKGTPYILFPGSGGSLRRIPMRSQDDINVIFEDKDGGIEAKEPGAPGGKDESSKPNEPGK